MKALVVGLWATGVALGSAYGAAQFMPAPGEAPGPAASVVLQSQKTRVINVPIVIDGAVRGFVSAQFNFTADGAAVKALAVPPEVYLLDEAFRTLYADAGLDPRHVERYDLRKLTAHLVAATNERLGAPLVKDVLIENFSYIDKDADKS